MFVDLPSSIETGALGVPRIRRMRAFAMVTKNGAAVDRTEEIDLDRQVLNALGLGLHQVLEYLFVASPTFHQFEEWIVATAGNPDDFCKERLCATVTGSDYPASVQKWLREVDASAPVLTDSDLSFWEEYGYVVLRNAVSESARKRAETAVWEYTNATPDDTGSWYQGDKVNGIMVELVQHPALDVCRRSARIHKAFAQLWGTADLWVTADRCGFHPPQTVGYPFPGPDLHWDIDFDQPLEFGTQGILYLTDTAVDQGALTVVPGFHRRMNTWLSALDSCADPQQKDLHALGSMPIGGQAGDMVIWNQLLPHGSRPNLGRQPRIVQYINMLPSTSAMM